MKSSFKIPFQDSKNPKSQDFMVRCVGHGMSLPGGGALTEDYYALDGALICSKYA